MRLNFKI